MQVPIEFLTQLMLPRADLFAGIGKKAQGFEKSDSAFSKVLDEKLSAVSSSSAGVERSPVKDTGDVIVSQDSDDDTDQAEDILVGEMGHQNMVVFILEGDKESAADPDINIGAVSMDNAGGNALDLAPQLTVEADAGTEQEGTIAIESDNGQVAGELEKAMQQSANSEALTDSLAGEATARMPEIRTSEQQEKEDVDSEFSNNGDLSPLENVNDAISTIGQKEKADTKEDEFADNAAESSPESYNNAPVLITDSIKTERFQGDQQMRQAAPVASENLFDEMVNRIEMMQTQEQQSVMIELKPEFLGKVALEIAMDAAGLHVKISADDNGIRGMINGQINALIESLENKGIEVVEVEVAYTGVDNGDYRDSRENQAQSNQPRRSNSVNSIEDSAAYFAALQLDALEYYLDTGVSSVEYSA